MLPCTVRASQRDALITAGKHIKIGIEVFTETVARLCIFIPGAVGVGREYANEHDEDKGDQCRDDGQNHARI